MASGRLVVIVLLSVVAFGFLPAGAAEAPSDTAASTEPKLEGIWRAVSMFNMGKRISKENVKKLHFEFTDKKITMRLEGRVLAETDFAIDKSTKPASIEMLFEGKPTLGILTMEGRRMSLCLSGSKEQRPTKFISEADSPNRMLIHLCWGEFPPGRPISVANSDGSDLRQLGLPNDMACGSPDWSPDGKQVACDAWFLSRGEDYSNGHITIVPVDGGEITDLGLGAMPSWSPDGKRMVLCKYNPRGVWMMTADGTNEKYIDPEGWGCDWSPVGNEIAYTVREDMANIRVVDPDTEESRTLLETEQFRSIYWNMSWSPDGEAICFQGIRPDGTREIVRVSSQGDAEGFKVLHSDQAAPQFQAILTTVSWAGSAEQILVSMRGPEDKFRQLYTLDAEGKNPPKLFPGQNPDCENGDMAWSSDGKQVAYVSWEPD